MSEEREIKEKERRVRKFLKEQQLDGLLLSKSANFAWLTGGKDNHVFIATEGGVASILITKDKKYIITNSKYFIVITGLFLVVTIAIIWFFFPPVLKTFNENKAQSNALTEQIKSSQAEASTVKDLVAAKTTIADLYDTATTARGRDLPGVEVAAPAPLRLQLR